ncbi:low temperature requirement protein A [Streptomyces sp. NPDC002758]
MGPAAPSAVAAAAPSWRAAAARAGGSPLELFHDLVIVVLVAQASHHIAGHLTWHGPGEFATVFAPVWIAWPDGSLHHELHGHDDARSRICSCCRSSCSCRSGRSSPKPVAPAEPHSP